MGDGGRGEGIPQAGFIMLLFSVASWFKLSGFFIIILMPTYINTRRIHESHLRNGHVILLKRESLQFNGQ